MLPSPAMRRLIVLSLALALPAGCSTDGPTTPGATDLTPSSSAEDLSIPEDLGSACQDRMRDGDETDIDCGGGLCPACGTGATCLLDSDCLSTLCAMGACAAGPSCSDAHKNGEETDVDCGGPGCAPCQDGLACRVNDDCASGYCKAGICAALPVTTLSFAAPVEYMTLGGDYAALAIADFSGDGRADVATASIYGARVALYRGKGAGALATPDLFFTNTGETRTLLAADLTGDNKPDVAVSDLKMGQVQILPGSQGGGLGAAVTLTTMAQRSGALAAGDFDGDGKRDLAACAGQCEVFYGLGQGKFAPSVNKGIATGVRLASLDLNGDGLFDLVSFDYDNAAIVYLAGANRTFQAGTMVTLVNLGNPSDAFDVGQLDGDGKADLVVVPRETLSVFRGDGKGGFTPGKTSSVPQPGDHLVLADFNGDGYDDVVLAQGAADVAVHLNDRKGAFRPRTVFTLTNTANVFNRYLAVGDLNGDGKPDIAATLGGNGGAPLIVLLNTTK